jgi:hypothetical protein
MKCIEKAFGNSEQPQIKAMKGIKNKSLLSLSSVVKQKIPRPLIEEKNRVL